MKWRTAPTAAAAAAVTVGALVTACGGGATGGAPKAAAPSDSAVSRAAAFPEGTYTTTATRRDALRFDHKDPCALEHGGLRLKLEFADGSWTERQSCEVLPEQVGSRGTYTTAGDRLMLSESCCGTSTLAWTFDGEALTLRPLSTETGGSLPGDFRFVMEHRWTKSG